MGVQRVGRWDQEVGAVEGGRVVANEVDVVVEVDVGVKVVLRAARTEVVKGELARRESQCRRHRQSRC